MELIEKLKKHCHQQHLHVRAGEYADQIMNQQITEHEYVKLLYANYFFHSTIESQITTVLSEEWKEELAWPHRLKANYIKQDLMALQKSLPTQALHKHYASQAYSINTLSEAIGALYVIEGTAIGGAIIKRNLLKTGWIIQKGLPIHFYGCYGKELSARWKQFIQMTYTPEIDHSVALQQASITFDFYEKVLEITDQFMHSHTVSTLKLDYASKAS